MKDNEELHFLSHPDVQDIVGNSLEEMMLESDRGAVLIAAEVISSALKSLFKTIIPNELGKEKRDQILSYPSPLGTLSGKADIAYAVQIINKDVYHSITILRRLRNDAAHTDVCFRLVKHKDRLKEILEVGNGGYCFATTSAYEIITNRLYKSLTNNNELEAKLGEKLFADFGEFIEYMKDNERYQSMVEDRSPKVSLSIGVLVLCGLIIYQRDSYLKKITSE